MMKFPSEASSESKISEILIYTIKQMNQKIIYQKIDVFIPYLMKDPNLLTDVFDKFINILNNLNKTEFDLYLKTSNESFFKNYTINIMKK